MEYVFLFLLMTMLKLATFNTNGLRDMDKFRKVAAFCEADIVCLQETHWDSVLEERIKRTWPGQIFTSHGTNIARGVAIGVSTNCKYDVHLIDKDSGGRWLRVSFEMGNVGFVLLTLHAPNEEHERTTFFRNIKNVIKTSDIIMGDFNIKLNRLDISENCVFKSDASRSVLQQTMNECDLSDVWREKNPVERDFSRVQLVKGELKQSRIDLCLLKNKHIEMVRSVNHSLTPLSDHAGLFVGMGERGRGRGGGVWVMNGKLLNNTQYKAYITNVIKSETMKPVFEEQILEGWENLKTKIKYKTIQFAKKLRFKEKERENYLKREITKENNRQEVNTERLLNLQGELKGIEGERCEGAVIRSRAQYAVEGERSTAFFLNLEKRKQNRCYLEELQNSEGKKVTDLIEVLEVVQKFYSELFKAEGTDPNVAGEILEKIDVTLNSEDKCLCDQEIVEDDIEKAISQMVSNKSPGSDGLTSNFYKALSGVLKPILLRVFKEMERQQRVPESMTLGLITLIFKKGDKSDLTNYRPITLLNNDYKILMKIFANRIKEVLHTIIAPTQAYSVPGREVSDIFCTIRDSVDFLKETGQPGILLALDFDKAFDRVEHDFLFNVLRKYGFGGRIIKWIQLLYSNAVGSVKCNGIITDSFPLTRSVRQGCPMSSILYSIVAEPLANLLKKDETINGIELPGGKGVSYSNSQMTQQS